jgi:hypothetical protein
MVDWRKLLQAGPLLDFGLLGGAMQYRRSQQAQTSFSS